ncbi:MAG: prephenate dehydrogenase/arogenate dehydrogenase family protein [Gemmatimonadales bacterium]
MDEQPTTMAHLRAALADVDDQILQLAARRQRLAREIGTVKNRAGTSLRDYAQEKRVLDRAHGVAREEGMSSDFVNRLMTLLIASSLTTQEQERVRSRRHGAGRRALVIGGAGRMGGWFVRFLASQGFAVEIADPASLASGISAMADWREASLDHPLIVVATPLRTTARILGELAERRPRGVVFDIGSVKAPLAESLLRLRDAGAQVTSLHPLFGPDTELLSGRHVVLVDLGVESANAAARALFAPTMASVVTMDLARHDEVMATVLGLSHALNIGFFTALAETGEPVGALRELSSTTFDRQLAVAAPVAEENPHLYFEIQHLNPYGLGALDRLVSAMERIRTTVRQGDEAGFRALMERGREWLGGFPAGGPDGRDPAVRFAHPFRV